MCVGRENSGYENNVNNAAAQQIYGEIDGNGNKVEHTKVNGTAKATAFNVVSIDRKNQKIYAYIFGAGKDRVFYYGEEVITRHLITSSLNNCTGASGNATSINVGGSVTLTFTANDGYILPDTVYVSGASYNWDKATVTLVLSDATSDVIVAITAVEDVPVNLLDMSERTLYTSYTDSYIEATAPHTMDYTKVYAVASDNRRGKYPTDKFSAFTPVDDGFSANCSSSSGYRLEVPVKVEGGKSYELTVNSDASTYTIHLLKYNADTSLNGATTLLSNVKGKQTTTFTTTSGYLYSIVFPFASGTRTFTELSLTEK
jgi:hypothetical protein